jgi:hydrogenase expression/formation protein HypE
MESKDPAVTSLLIDIALELERIVRSMDEALTESGAALVTGDTKVVERGSLDKIVINTAGIGIAEKVVRDNGFLPGDGSS